ncbi:cell division protein ZapE [Pelagibacterium sp. 26DY04]|uniref:cell division protein ZapE n=1 Tax=Pelagibacterium sp. 26DY04 TaxID=2967130 RepID=UPI00281621D9|nr:cell division protein ZapE [Pelagibacterium sp. 26DY04]WMT86857.1 cell division protein ZapE [Pelagibacterium sp. 26DY04]
MAGGEGAGGSILDAYAELVISGQVKPDAAQKQAVEKLQAVAEGLDRLEAQSGSVIAALFRRKREAPKGLYIWGDVGRGKTMLMDLFFQTVPVENKRRVHFHEFMNEVHEAIAKFRAENPGTKGARDPIPAVARPITRSVRLLCFDEFFVSDITDAMLLKRLFEILFADGVVVVATSNIPPEKLYWNGLNRQLFLPFIDLLESHAEVFNLNGATDYRREKLDAQEVYHFGTGPEIDAAMDRLFAHLTGGAEARPNAIESLGRVISVPAHAMGVARFDFADLCERPLGARDYLKIANGYHTLMVEHVPVFSCLKSDASKRFILLVDTLYDRGVKLAASFAAPLDELAQDDKTRFEFARCLSRLEEMRSADYIAQPLRQQRSI